MYLSFAADPNDAMLEELDSLAARIRAEADVFIVCGIGGSYLGARAVIDALSDFFGHNGPEILYAGHHMNGKYLEELLEYLEQPNAEGEQKSVYLNVISKSGTTLETALSFRMIRNWMEEQDVNKAVEQLNTLRMPSLISHRVSEKLKKPGFNSPELHVEVVDTPTLFE